jgi:hypothetical protein
MSTSQNAEENSRRGSFILPATYLFPSPAGQPILVEYRTQDADDFRMGIVYVAPGELHSTIRHRIQHNAATLQLFKANEVFTDFEGPGGYKGEGGFFVVWGSSAFPPKSAITDQQEFLACLRMMERRGWIDRFLAVSEEKQWD